MLPAWDSIATSLLGGQHCGLLVLQGEGVNEVSGHAQGSEGQLEPPDGHLHPPCYTCGSSLVTPSCRSEVTAVAQGQRFHFSSAMGPNCHSWATTAGRVQRVLDLTQPQTPHIYSSAPWECPVLVPQNLSGAHARSELQG